MTTHKGKDEGARPLECVGGPLDGDVSSVPAGCDTFDHHGHLYRLDREDTGALFWRYAGYCLIGEPPK